MNYAVKFNNITKKYEDTIALNDVSLSIEAGKVYGLIGRNGAGKTTMLKLMSNMIFTTEGSIEYNKAYIQSNQDICFVRDFNHYFSNQKIKTILYMASKIYPNWDFELEKELLETFELSTKKTYLKGSKGMQTMTSIIVALCSNAKLLLLDEPYAGLDPINREAFYQVLREKCFDGEKTVILSSHLINELEGYFEKAIMINKGKIFIDDDIEKIYEMSYAITCNEKTNQWLKANKRILREENALGINVLYIYDQITENEKKQLMLEGADIKGMDLQKLLVTFCSKGEV